MIIFLIFCFGVFATGLVQNDQIYNNLANFWTNNGMVFVSLTSIIEQPLLQNKAQMAYVTFQKYGLRARRLSYEKLYKNLKFDSDSLILLTEKRILSEPNTFYFIVCRSF